MTTKLNHLRSPSTKGGGGKPTLESSPIKERMDYIEDGSFNKGWKEYAGAAVLGFTTGGAAGLTMGASLAVQAAALGVGGIAGSVGDQLIRKGKVDFGETLFSGALCAAMPYAGKYAGNLAKGIAGKFTKSAVGKAVVDKARSIATKVIAKSQGFVSKAVASVKVLGKKLATDNRGSFKLPNVGKGTSELNTIFRKSDIVGDSPISLKQLKQTLGKRGMSISNKYDIEHVPEILDPRGNKAFASNTQIGDFNVERGVNGRPLIKISDLGLSSTEQGVKSIFHEIDHIKSILRNNIQSSEEVAEAYAEKMFNIFVKRGKNLNKRRCKHEKVDSIYI